MDLRRRLPRRRSRAELAKERGAELAHSRKAQAAAAGVAGAGAAAMALMKRRTHGNGQGPRVHTTPAEGHPAGTGERSDRDIGGPTSREGESPSEVTGGAPGTPPGSGFEPHS
jgi:hypothetical protein